MGPADPLFLGMFFYAVHKFQMRAKETLLWMVPALALYLVVVLAFGSKTFFGISLGALPALVPIGAVLVLVNRKEFHLTREERISTIGVAVLCVAAIVAAFIVWR
jgi:hypothetical protein